MNRVRVRFVEQRVPLRLVTEVLSVVPHCVRIKARISCKFPLPHEVHTHASKCDLYEGFLEQGWGAFTSRDFFLQHSDFVNEVERVCRRRNLECTKSSLEPTSIRDPEKDEILRFLYQAKQPSDRHSGGSHERTFGNT